MYIPRVNVTNIAVSGEGNTAVTTLTIPGTFTPVPGTVCDIVLSAQVPVATSGTILSITNGTVTGTLYQVYGGNYARARELETVKALRVHFLNDPAHFNLLSIRR